MRLFGKATARRLSVRATVLGGLVALVAACGDSGGDREHRIGSLLMGPTGGGTAEIDLPDIADRPGRACPPVSVRDGTQTMRIYARGMEGDPRSVVYQGSIRRVARECRYEGDRLYLTVGISGRVLVGPAGQGGDMQLPIRAAFLPRGGQPSWTGLFRVPVTVTPEGGGSDFSHVEQSIELELPAGESPGRYIMFVGFDEVAAGRS